MTAPSATPDDPTTASAGDAEPEPGSAAIVDTLSIERGGIGRATATEVEVRLGGIGAVEAEDVFVQWGGIGATRADTVGVEFGSLGAALAGEVRVSQGFAGMVVAREATLEQAISRTVVAQRVTINRPSAIGILIAQQVEGSVRPLLDWRGALAAGTALGVAALIRTAITATREPAGRRLPRPLRRR